MSAKRLPGGRPQLLSQARHWNASCSFSTSRRLSSVDPPAASVAASFVSRFQSLGPQTRAQRIDANQLQLLTLTLNRPSLFPGSPSLSNTPTAPPAETSVPPGYHLVYFTPAFLEGELGPDGTDASYNPEAPFTRRMWAGGEVLWPRSADGKPNPLRVGQEVRETTRVLSAEPKVVMKTGEDMIVVGVEKEFSNDRGISIIDRRNWVFRKALPTPSAFTPVSTAPPSASHRSQASASAICTEGNTHSRTVVQSPVTLFRFSALTFNPHKIHYSLPWARDVEGHRDIVVHGPLNLISILDLWRDTRNNGADPTSVIPQRISYRATSPLYAGDEYQIKLQDEGDMTKVHILGPGGVVAMKAEIQG
ncbi:uncharacterized protein N7482_010605 [Penicillium canariense]|uniref:Mesaconyl-C4 CoA hydratase n=1 Tax=Penicillium canariense TaxID=189055 RepID=A0A9W9HK14_9EURO|nr:uncharacterized protein N7482_010605 [Penicillium canariense]KAJ5151353.1 hypothetical protein N7482_010605 [Penicillium canariense]